MHRTTLTTLAAAAALAAAPAGALAHDQGHGPGEQGKPEHAGSQGIGRQGKPEHSDSRGQKVERPEQHVRHEHVWWHGRAYRVSGIVKAVDATGDTVTITVGPRHGDSNKAARPWSGKDVTFDLSRARIAVRDVNGDGTRDLKDVKAGDRVVLLAKLPHRLRDSDTQPFKAKKLADVGPKPQEQPKPDEPQPEQPKPEEPQPQPAPQS